MKKIFITLLLLLVTIIPISATNYPPQAYEVPWTETAPYIIFTSNGTTYAFVNIESNSGVLSTMRLHKHPTLNIFGVRYSTITVTPRVRLYTLQSNNTWLSSVPSENSSFNASTGFHRYFNMPQFNQIVASNQNVLNHNSTNSILFRQAPFQLQLTPLELALEGALNLITTHFGTILLVGLVVFGIILAIRLGVRGLRLVIR